VAIIYSGQLRNGRLPPDYSHSTEDSVSVILPGGPADLDFVQLLVTEENRQQRTFGVSKLLVLAHLWHNRSIDTATAAALTQRDEAQIRATLEHLVEGGLLEGRGATKGRTYLLSAGVYRSLGRPSAYVRARGFEPEQIEQMILQYVRAHGRIARKDAAELCRLSVNQASYLLKTMADRGIIRLIGKGRTAHYTLPANTKSTRNKSE